MKATLVDEPFDDPDWIYEIKWDGYRALARVSTSGAELISRNNIAFTKYYPIIDLLGKWNTDALIDGEVVVINDKGISDFGALQNWTDTWSIMCLISCGIRAKPDGTAAGPAPGHFERGPANRR
jgi:ATP-dependent DNA ligase